MSGCAVPNAAWPTPVAKSLALITKHRPRSGTCMHILLEQWMVRGCESMFPVEHMGGGNAL